MPSRAPRPLPTMIDIGTASPIAQGQAMISTDTAATTACARSGPNASHSAKLSAASPITTGTKTRVTRSTSACTGRRAACACSTSATIRDSTVSWPVAVTR